VVERFLELQKAYPGRVLSLLGNHEHSHIGGVHLGEDSDELEKQAGERLEVYKKEFNGFPLLVLTRCGLVFCHGAPELETFPSLEEIAALEYGGHGHLTITNIYDNAGVLGRLLWSRMASYSKAKQFLHGISGDGNSFHVTVSGHDPVSEGFEKAESNQLVLSTSFRMQRENKFYLRVDLAGRYRSVDDLREGEEILCLY